LLGLPHYINRESSLAISAFFVTYQLVALTVASMSGWMNRLGLLASENERSSPLHNGYSEKQDQTEMALMQTRWSNAKEIRFT
jgi:hypothetical protein